uniref:Uncharacterized protein n=1 Tax=Meloidogyne enterolobii TaxID=390850 RepID=A0A6V7W7Q8_MELEN|nr:unnamed protein product [Meloidogyne enterolobii]
MAKIEDINYAKKCFDKNENFLKENKDISNRVLDIKKYLDNFATIKGKYLILTKKEKFEKQSICLANALFKYTGKII